MSSVSHPSQPTTSSDWLVDIPTKFSVEEPNQPSPGLVLRVTRQLDRAAGGTGFAVLQGVQDILADRQRRFQFTVALMEAIWRQIRDRAWTAYEDKDVRMNVFEANDGSLPVEIVGDTVTFKRLHFDPHSIIFAHMYEASCNLRGGALTFVDVRSYLEAEGLGLDEVFRPLSRLGHEGRLVARSRHRVPLLVRFGVTVQPPGPGEAQLVVVRNDPVAGVAHEIAPVSCIDVAAPTERRFLRASVSPHH